MDKHQRKKTALRIFYVTLFCVICDVCFIYGDFKSPHPLHSSNYIFDSKSFESASISSTVGSPEKTAKR